MWVIYYDDGKTFSSRDGTWAEAPTDGVLFVLEKLGDRVITHSGNDFYIEIDGTIAATGDASPLMRRQGWKFGRWTSHKRYEEIGRRVAADAKSWAG
jgi:hypothetical protein